MEQYHEIREQLPPNTLLLFRLGDFYEMFEADAEEGAALLGITLTQRNGQPMAGIPYHAADNYIQKVLRAGRKVAICDQVETPKPGQLVKRSLTRILSPGTTLEDQQIDSASHRFVVAVNIVNGEGVAAWLDVTTGDFVIGSSAPAENLVNVLHTLDARELVLPKGGLLQWGEDIETAAFAERVHQLSEGLTVSEVDPGEFEVRDGDSAIRKLLGVLNLDGFGIGEGHLALGAAGAVLNYVTEHLCEVPQNVHSIRLHQQEAVLQMDPATIRNLELFRTTTGQREGSLLSVMDGTATAPGKRLLERWLASPTLDLQELQRRQDCVGEFSDAPAIAAEVNAYLRGVRDLPRILGRLRNRIRNPREAGAVRETLRQLPLILQTLEALASPIVDKLAGKVGEFAELRDLLERSLQEELPNQLSDGGVIGDGFDADLDEIRSMSRNSQQWLSDFEAKEIERTGIRKLRIKFNNAFGYFIEVTKSNLSLVPADYIRRQTMTNAERYTTPELKEKERDILSAEERAIAREECLFRDIVAAILAEGDDLDATAQALAEIDVLSGWARISRERGYCKPCLDSTDELEIEAGRHPVVEEMMRRRRIQGLPGEDRFVPNDTRLVGSSEQIAILTGPNMAGKSTFIRQVALIVLMAQTGCWVPAERAKIGLVDRIFSRVGASDELARGNSTFMVEMNETANILNNATERSLIILDEIGRGTSTYDGLSIAWAVVEHLHGKGDLGPRTLFATHYHELTQIARQLPRVRNYSVTVKEWNDQIIFVRTVQEGAADRSYGIQVARLAGLPESVIQRAMVILGLLESDDSSHNLLRKTLKGRMAEEIPPQLELF